MRRMYSKPQLLEAVEQESKVNGIKVFEDIKDKDGHNRFIEGEINLKADVESGTTKIYGKWSLSGTHLTIVLCVAMANTTVRTGSLAKVEIPKWILDKIVPIASNIVVYKPSQYAIASDASMQTITHMLNKLSETELYIYTGSLTLNADRVTRISFDLLIDDE